MYNTDSGVGDSAEGMSRLRAAYSNRKLSDAFHHLSDQLLQRYIFTCHEPIKWLYSYNRRKQNRRYFEKSALSSCVSCPQGAL